MTMLVRMALNAAALVAVAYLLEGVELDGWGPAALAVVLLALVNATLRPLLLLLTIPINLVTLGLFTFVINAAMMLLVSGVVGGFRISGFGAALVAALAYSVISWFLNGLAGTGRGRRRR